MRRMFAVGDRGLCSSGWPSVVTGGWEEKKEGEGRVGNGARTMETSEKHGHGTAATAAAPLPPPLQLVPPPICST